MKRYENTTEQCLTLKTPAIIRIDGCHFHTFTRGLKKPFDAILMRSMQETMQVLCEEIQGCVLGYTQSDEISLVLIDYPKHETAAWFDYRVQKCASIAAAKATKHFNRIFAKHANEWIENYHEAWNVSDADTKYAHTLQRCIEQGAEFDARIFNLPISEVCNYIYWRQDDATRNSIQMVGHANFSTSEMKKKNNKEVQEMLFSRKGINWNNLPIEQKRGVCCIKVEREFINKDGETFVRKKWELDRSIPIFSGENRKYIDDLVDLIH
jgi:tRNA(His) 5'-end guanylyltransferase